MNTSRTLRLRKEVLTELADDDLVAVVGGIEPSIRHCAESRRFLSCVAKCHSLMSC